MATKRDTYIEKMATQLKEWSARVDELEEKVTGSATDLRIDFDVRIRDLKEKRDRLELKLRELKDSGDDAWTIFTEGVEAARKDLKTAIVNAKNRLRRAA